MRNIINLTGLAFSALLLAGGCAAPKVLVGNSIVGSRTAKTVMQQTGVDSSGSTSQGMYNYSILLCDYGDRGQTQNCGETVVLQNVTRRP